MIFENPYWSNKLKIQTLQRWIIVHSILYYEMDNSVIDDLMFDKNARQLVKMQSKFPDESKNTAYWYIFKDFDGTTGYDIYGKLTEKDKVYLSGTATHVLDLVRRNDS